MLLKYLTRVQYDGIAGVISISQVHRYAESQAYDLLNPFQGNVRTTAWRLMHTQLLMWLWMHWCAALGDSTDDAGWLCVGPRLRLLQPLPPWLLPRQ